MCIRDRRRTIAARLLSLKEAPLHLDDERHLGLHYMAVLTSPGELDNLDVYKRQGLG